jgi:transposase
MQYAKISNQFKYFCGGDIHSDKSYFNVVDQTGKVVLKKNLPNNFALLKDFLNPVMGDVAIGVESNYNYYWIADGCAKEDIPFYLGHAYYMKAIAANKNKTDSIDAKTIAHLMRANLFPLAYPYPEQMRAVRDLLRRRHYFVRIRSALYTHTQMTMHQQGVHSFKHSLLRDKTEREFIIDHFDNNIVQQNITTDLNFVKYLDKEIEILEKTISEQVKLQKHTEYALLTTIPGVGLMTALNIIYETHDISRFKTHQKFASYCRVVKPERVSNGVKKKSGNPKMGNPYLKWAFGQILHSARNASEPIDKHYLKLERKSGKKKARAIMAHKFNTTAYFMLKNGNAFDMKQFLNTN